MWGEPDYEGTRRVSYEGGECFIPVCKTCGRFVKADETLRFEENFLTEERRYPNGNATCSKHGRVEMPFEGYF